MIEKILSKYRVDGPIGSPIRFLTIEDGDGGTDFKNLDEVTDYFSRSEEEFTWIPDSNSKLTRDDVSPVGVWIAKIMAKILKNLDICETEHKTYLRDSLYRQYEHNIKFYSFGRNNVNFFPDWLIKELGITNTEYKNLAVKSRTKIFVDMFVCKPSKVNIILGAENEWWGVFKLIYPNLHVVEQGDNIRCAYSGDEKDKLVYIYFSIFAQIPGSKNARAEATAAIAASELKNQGVNIT